MWAHGHGPELASGEPGVRLVLLCGDSATGSSRLPFLCVCLPNWSMRPQVQGRSEGQLETHKETKAPTHVQGHGPSDVRVLFFFGMEYFPVLQIILHVH